MAGIGWLILIYIENKNFANARRHSTEMLLGTFNLRL